MWREIFALLATTIVLVASTGDAQAQGAQSRSPWAEFARMDLEAIRDTLAENHPGPVDPQNSRYGEWLREGFDEAIARAQAADSFTDYHNAVRFFANGFRDGHIGINFVFGPNSHVWPRMLVHQLHGQEAATVFHSRIDTVPIGAELVSCDDQSVDALLAETVDPYYFNADIPHTRSAGVRRLFILNPDEARRYERCSFRIDGEEREVAIAWYGLSHGTRDTLIAQSRDERPELGLRRAGDVWIVGLPSFAYSGTGANDMQALVDQIAARREDLRGDTVVLDVRGNGGGNSAWGARILSALFGESEVERIANSFDNTIDWRVSDRNIADLEGLVEQSRADGLHEAADYYGEALDLMRAARNRGEELARQDLSGTASGDTHRPAARPQRVYLLTDGYCASACLDFADIARRLPNVTHIGRPTSADAVYIDNRTTDLPSGLALLSYSLKVYRNRVRGNNEFYTPEITWPGGPMTDEAVEQWVAELAASDG